MGVTESKPVGRVHAFAEGEKTKAKNADRSAGVNAVAGRRTVLRSGSSRRRRLAMKEFVGLDEVAVHDNQGNSDGEEEEFFRRKPTAKETQQKTAPSSLNDVLGFLRSKKTKKTWQQRAVEKKANNNRVAAKEDEVYNEAAKRQAEKLQGLEEATRLQRKANSAAFKQGSYRPERDGSFAKKASRLRQERESRQSGLPPSILLKRGSSKRSLALRGDGEERRAEERSDLKRIHSHRRIRVLRMSFQTQ